MTPIPTIWLRGVPFLFQFRDEMGMAQSSQIRSHFFSKDSNLYWIRIPILISVTNQMFRRIWSFQISFQSILIPIPIMNQTPLEFWGDWATPIPSQNRNRNGTLPNQMVRMGVTYSHFPLNPPNQISCK